MNCPKCNTTNDDDNVFCVNCGATISSTLNTISEDALPTEAYRQDINQTEAFHPTLKLKQDLSKTTAPIVFQPEQSQQYPAAVPALPTPAGRKSGKNTWLAILGVLVLLGACAAAGIYFYRQTANTETLPDHFGMFFQNKEKNAVSEIAKQDFTNVVRAKEDLLKNEALPMVEDKPNVILFSDIRDVPLSELKLIQLDSIKEDGSLMQIAFQAAPVEGKLQMKRIRVPEGLAKGKYAFALFDGYLEEGKHKFWAFQVSNSEKNDNGDLAKALALNTKPKVSPSPTPSVSPTPEETVKPSPTPKPTPSVPVGARVAYCNSTDVLLRSSPSLNGKKVNKLNRGQRVYIIEYSDNYDDWRGVTANWAYVQTEGGQRGWVFTPFVSY